MRGLLWMGLIANFGAWVIVLSGLVAAFDHSGCSTELSDRGNTHPRCLGDALQQSMTVHRLSHMAQQQPEQLLSRHAPANLSTSTVCSRLVGTS